LLGPHLHPCITESDSQDRSRRGRSLHPESEKAVGELESPRLDQHRRQARTVAGAGIRLGRIAQGGALSVIEENRSKKVESEKVYVGVDVSKDRLDVAIRPHQELWSEANDPSGVKRLVKRLKGLNCARVVVEATGGYESLLVSVLWAESLPVVVVNPRWVRAFARSLGQLAKTDAIDARVLALYAQRAELKVRELPNDEIRQLRALCARREDLLDMLTAEQNRLEHALAPVRREINRHIEYLRKQLKQLDHDIDRTVRGSELYRQINQLLDSVPGVGPVLRAWLLAWLPELGRLTRVEIAKLVGVAPLNQDSGKFRGVRRIAGGRAPLRKVLYMATFAAMRHNPYLRAYYDHLRKRGKEHKVALVATMRKLLLILNAIVKTNTPWRTLPCLAAANN
jgi:transposase